MNLAHAVVQNPVKVAVGALLLALFGGVALTRMPMQLVPEVETPTITVETHWPGASPQEVEQEIVQEQEEQLKGVEGVTKMTAESMDSRGTLTLEFAVGTDMTEALLRVNARLQQVREYPEEADQPILSTSSSSDRAIAWFIVRPRLPSPGDIAAFQRAHPELAAALEPVLRAVNTGLRHTRLARAAEAHPEIAALLPEDIDVTLLKRFAEDTIEARFERVPGVSNSNVIGGREDEMQVVVDPQRLAARQLTILDLREALQARNVDTSGGDFWDGKRRYVVRTLGEFTSPEAVESVIIAERDGARVYVRDVAEVHLGYKKADEIVRNIGANVLAVNVIREGGANVLAVMRGLYQAVEELNAGPLAGRGLSVQQVYDETDYIHSSINLLRGNIVLGAILTIVVLLLFLRSARSTLVIAVAIPTSIIGTFLVLDLLGRSLNVVSLAGLAFAVGMLVDNAVVVLENIYRHYQLGKRRFAAAVDGTREVWGAVLSSTLTTMAVFVPILFIEEEAGQLFRDIALAISAAVGLSLIVAVTLIPTFTARILPRRTGVRTPRAPRRNVLRFLLLPFDALARGFVATVLGLHFWLEKSVWRQMATVAVFVVGSFLGTKALWPKVEYLPEGDRNLVLGILLPPPGYNLDQMVRMAETIESRLGPYWTTDPGTPEALALDYPIIDQYFFVVRGRQVFMGMRTYEPRRVGELMPLFLSVSRDLPGTMATAFKSSLFERGLTAGRAIDIEITGPDLTRLVALGGRVMGMAAQSLPGAQLRPIPSPDLSSPEVHVEPRWERAEELGVSAAGLGYTVDSLVDGAYAGDYYFQGEKIDLTIIGQERFASSFQDLPNLSIATPTGDLVPLSAVADVKLSSGPEQINRRERERAITIQVRPPVSMPLEAALDTVQSEIIKPLVDQNLIGGDYRVTLAGTADKLKATWKALSFNVFLAVLITYLLMAALFESWLQPLVVIFSVPLGAVGGVAGLALLNVFVYQPLDVLTMLGFVVLIGTVVNNAILIVHQSIIHIRDEGEAMKPAVRRSVRTRIRPIFMTTTTTVCGLLPLVLQPGAGSELYRGLGSVLLGGLVVSTVFTLVLIPTLFRLTMGAQQALKRRLGGEDEPGVVAPDLVESQPVAPIPYA